MFAGIRTILSLLAGALIVVKCIKGTKFVKNIIIICIVIPTVYSTLA